MRKNNIVKISVLALLSCFALVACNDDIIAKPTGYDENSPVMSIPQGEDEVFGNNLTEIYDSIRDGNLASDVLDQLLYQYSVSVFGNYNQVTAKVLDKNYHANGNENSKYGNITLKKAVAGVTTDANGKLQGNEDAKAFIKAHSAFWSKDKNGNRIDDKKATVDKDADPSQSEYTRLKNKWAAIEKRIAKKLYGAISGGSYSDRNVFEEIKYLRSLEGSVDNKVVIPADAEVPAAADATKPKLFEGVLTSKVEDEAVFDDTTANINGIDDYILHREYYQSSFEDATDDPKRKEEATYVEDKLIPDIYRQLLVEQYILDESYDTLGRTSARHIDVLSIKKNSNFSKGAANLMDEFVKNTIFNKDREHAISLDDFKVVSNAWVGAFMSKTNYSTDPDYKPMYDLMHKAVPEYEKKTSDNKPYFQGTAYGDMMEEYDKINNNPRITENEGTFTGSGAYTKDIGLTIKTRELETQDHTSTGWYVKNVGVDGLPDSIKSKLFDINVANAIGINGENCVEYFWNENLEGDDKWDLKEKDDENGKYINVVGKVSVKKEGVAPSYFLRNTSRVADTPIQNDILFEEGDTYYIVLINEAIRSSDLNKDNYVKKEGQSDDDFVEDLLKLENYINEIAQIVANNDTYQTLSKKHWLEKMDLKYHDTVVYDYFKSNFPDLFEDD